MESRTKKQALRELLGANVRALRNRLSLSQEELAEAADLTQVFISKVESANAAATVDTIEKLAKGLRCDPSLLLMRNALEELEAGARG